jgi:hypothetical protein
MPQLQPGSQPCLASGGEPSEAPLISPVLPRAIAKDYEGRCGAKNGFVNLTRSVQRC